MQGGASTQFTMVPLNLAQGKKATTLWVVHGVKAYTEAVKLSKTIPFEPILLASSEETVYDHIQVLTQQQLIRSCLCSLDNEQYH